MKGILFKPDMIKAIREGRKTQTRRVMQNQPVEMDKVYYKDFRKDFGGRKPRYQVGEVVYIKEAWTYGAKNQEPSGIIYKLDGTLLPTALQRGTYHATQGWGKWASPMFLKAKDARYFIEITAVRAERLQEISTEDCYLEGYQPSPDWDNRTNWKWARIWYSELWDSINPKHKWASNPWDFAYTFHPVSPEGLPEREQESKCNGRAVGQSRKLRR